MRSESDECDLLFRPLPDALTAPTHGRMEYFSLVTVRVRNSDRTEGLGYTCTVGKTGGPSVLAMLSHDVIAPVDW